MLTIHVWPRWLKAFLLAHPLYKSPKPRNCFPKMVLSDSIGPFTSGEAGEWCE